MMGVITSNKQSPVTDSRRGTEIPDEKTVTPGLTRRLLANRLIPSARHAQWMPGQARQGDFSVRLAC